MAAVSVQLSPHVAHNMANRRTPLSNISNAGNSPFRGTSASSKRARAQINAPSALENVGCQPPAAKRQAVEAAPTGPITPRKSRGDQRVNPATPTQRQHASRTREAVRTQKQEHLGESMEKLRQWQKHNEKTFPTYVFFFENVPENARRECSRGVRALGSAEAPFFSKDVTHIITTRAIPVESDANQSTDVGTGTSPEDHDKEQPRTIDPSILERDRSLDALASMQKSKFTFEAPRKPLAPTLDAENRNLQQSDILLRAKGMGIKIWSLDKLKRILDVMFDEGASSTSTATRSKLTSATSKPTQAQPQDLQQLISNEQLNGPTDRDVKGVYSDVVTFKGPYLYIRCCFERVKPVMVREWPKVVNRVDGEWPQFRSVSAGKCPFVEEDLRPRKPVAKETGKKGTKAGVASNKRVKPTVDTGRMQPPAVAGRKRPLTEVENSNKPLPVPGQQLPPPSKGTTDSSRPGTPQESAFVARSGLMGGEPMASGMQASNVTSAIRSQVISSTAAAPGAKAGTSREMHGLQRKVLARAHPPSGSSLTRSTGMTHLAEAAGQGDRGSRMAKQRAQERMGHSRLAQVVEGDGEDDEPETEHANTQTKAPAAAQPKIAREKREPKPGFCENCREKFDDFEEHTLSKRHRKFAATKENWTELDRLLSLLGRPQLRTAHSED